MSQIKKAVSYQSFESTDQNASFRNNQNANTLVVIKDYDPALHRLTVTRLSDGKPLKGKVSTSVSPEKKFEQSPSRVMKTLAAPDGPIVEVNDSMASLRGSANDGFFSFRSFGNIVKGPISFSAQPNEIRVGGLMTLNPILMSGAPSTMVTPVPTFVWSLPTGKMLGPITKDVALMSTLIIPFAP